MSTRRRRLKLAALCALASVLSLGAQTTVVARLPAAHEVKGKASLGGEAVLWLEPMSPTGELPPAAAGPFRLEQKNRAFAPHLLVVPVGATVSFPNDDPFFHNVFSLYNGKRFDLGLYESGTARGVVFNREGVSYIFCNIHPEMSAVVIALRTPWWTRADAAGALQISGVPAGRYEAHLWIDGADPGQLRSWMRPVVVSGAKLDLGLLADAPVPLAARHLNKFGQPYKPESSPY